MKHSDFEKEGEMTGKTYADIDLLGAIGSEADLVKQTSVFLDRSQPKSSRWQALREYYRLRHSEIMRSCRKARWFTPYSGGADWISYFTPIERNAWAAVRGQPLPFYPQFPAGKRILDFGNPAIRVGIEIDSKAWHDPDADFERDRELFDLGWATYRIPSRELNVPAPDWEGLDSLPQDRAKEAARAFLSGTIEGLFIALRFHYSDIPIEATEPAGMIEDHEWVRGELQASLHSHSTLADPDIDRHIRQVSLERTYPMEGENGQ